MTFLRALLLAFGLLLAASAQAAETDVTHASIGSADRIPAKLITPDGAGPFPAIVILHDCSGLGPRSSGSPRRWAEFLAAQGYVILIPDSFGPRGLPDGLCLAGSARVGVGTRAADAYGALAYLRTLPMVDGRRIGVMGGSHGGFSTLASMYVPLDPRNLLIAQKRDGFAAAVALYPACGFRFGAWSATRGPDGRGPITGYAGAYRPIAPLLILIGGKDDWTPAEPCERLAAASQAAGYPVTIKVYPGAHHAFDSAAPPRFVAGRNNANAPGGKGATTGGDPAAWADAKIQVSDFFARMLKP